MSSLNEQIVRELIDLIQRTPEGRQIDLSSLVLYLEEEVLGWLYGSTLHVEPLFDYCQPYTGWTPEAFMHYINPLEARLSSHHIDIDFSNPPAEETERTVIQMSPFGGAGGMAAAMVTGGMSAFGHDESTFTDAEKKALIDLIIKCSSKTEVEQIIDPDKLRDFLSEAIVEMYDDGKCDLQMLWEILLDAPGVSEDMLIPAFLLMEREESDIELVLPSLVQKLPEKMRQTMLAPFGIGAPPAPAASLSSGPSLSRSSAPEMRISSPPQSSQKSSGPKPSSRNTSSAKRPAIQTASKKYKSKGRGGKKESKCKGAAKKKGGANKGDKQGVPTWLLATAGVVIVLSGLFYFIFMRTSKPKLQGKIITVSSKALPLVQVRIANGRLLVQVKSSFMKLSDSERVSKAYKFWDKMRIRHRIFSMTLFDQEGNVIQTFNSR
jgi:hypothetical protein